MGRVYSATLVIPKIADAPVGNLPARITPIRSTGAAVKETSYYPPLADLLNTVGQTLKPRVRSVINIQNHGAGLLDGGLFTPDRLQKGADDPLEGQPPARRHPVQEHQGRSLKNVFDFVAVYGAGLQIVRSR